MYLNIHGEISYDTVVVRGVTEEDFSLENSRYAINKKDNMIDRELILSARIIIYK